MNRKGISSGLASLAIVAAMAGGCSSSAGLPNRTDAEVAAPEVGSDVMLDVARDLGVSPDVAMDVPHDLGSDAASPETGGSDAHEGGIADCHLAIDASLPFNCTPTFDDPSWRHGICDTPWTYGLAVRERLCGGFQSRSFDFGTHRWTCYYDPTTLVLVGGEFSDDINSFCDHTNYVVAAGDVPAVSCNTPFVESLPCGLDAGGQ